MRADKFGRTLQGLIEQDYGNQTEFARALNVSQGRVSQMVSGSYSGLSYASLEALLECFPTLDDQDALYEQWQSAYAPQPGPVLDPRVASEEEIQAYIDAVPRLIERGRFRSVVESLSFLIDRLRSSVEPLNELEFATAESYLYALNNIERSIDAVRFAREMAERTHSKDEPLWHARFLWRESIALRPIDPRSQLKSGSALELAAELLKSWTPTSADGKQARSKLIRSVVRDRAIAVWDVGRTYGIDNDLVERAVRSMNRVVTESESIRETSLGQEITARLSVLTNDPESTMRHLNVARELSDPADLTMAMKADVTEIRLLVSQSRFDEAEHRLADVLARAEKAGMFHYRTELTRLYQKVARAITTK